MDLGGSEVEGDVMKGGMLVLIDGCDGSGGSLLTGGRALLPETEEGGQPIPSRRHESPVVVGSGC